MPMLKTFNGMEQFMGKDTLTPDDVSGTLQDYHFEIKSG